MILGAQAIIVSNFDGSLIGDITQHDAVWVLLILGIIALFLIIVGRWRP